MLMIAAVTFALLLFRLRNRMREIFWSAVAALLALHLVMKDPVYYLVARIDISGGSKGWHRARLIESSIEHLDEWWLVGTDYTRHWMPTGIHANAIHTDITNHLLQMGVYGGLLLMLLFVAVLAFAFQRVGRAMRAHARAPRAQKWLIWTLGAILFGHLVNLFAITLFDQSVVFFYFILAAICAMPVSRRPAALPLASTRREPEMYGHAC
jgi:hypothetical protein